MTPRDLLITGAKELGIELSVEQVNSLFIYLTELRKWNRKISLTAIRDERDMIIKHMLDSLSYIKGFYSLVRPRLLDMGSGAGFPALPIKVIEPGISVTLVESVKKKASFLRHIIRTLELAGAEVIDKRIEEIETSSRSSYDVVTARAFATMDAALAAGTPFLRTGGLMVLSRGPEEIISEKEFLNAGVHLEEKIELTLPHSDYRRAIWVFKKT
jgi:16S rRNA (guanine527-N7)-methyltransferase